jgi:hypothetical protein
MKIVGLTYFDGAYRLVMKSDSSILQGKQPFFLPEKNGEIVAVPCLAVRISRMGRHIEQRFASRYYDAICLALNFRADELMRRGRLTEALAFDQAFALGQWTEPNNTPDIKLPNPPSIAELIETISNVMTLRTGDILFADIDLPRKVQTGQEYTLYINGQENLYCRIK